MSGLYAQYGCGEGGVALLEIALCSPTLAIWRAS